MDLRQLGDLVDKLPEIDFNWPGAEQLHPQCISNEIEKQGVDKYVIRLAERMAKYAHALDKMAELYNKIKDLVLDVEISVEITKDKE